MATGIEVGLSETQRQIVDLTREFARTRDRKSTRLNSSH